jgi:hypothetical protein
MQRQPDVAFAVARDDLETATGPYAAAVRAGYYPDRSGDVLYVLKQHRVLEYEPGGTSHGQPYAYDNQVPLLLLGKGVKPGVYSQQIRAVDVAPTVASLMEMGEPALSEGTTRGEAMAPLR